MLFTAGIAPLSLETGFKLYERFHGTKPDVSHLQAFGAPCFAVTTPYQRRNTGHFKLASRSQPVTFMGYSNNSKSYRLLTSSGDIILCRYEDTIFPLTSPPPSGTPVPDPVSLHSTVTPSLLPKDAASDSSDSDDFSFHSAESDGAPSPAPSPSLAPTPDPSSLVSLSSLSPPPRRSLRDLPRVDYSSAFSAVALDPVDVCVSPALDTIHQSGLEWFKLLCYSVASSDNV